MRGSSNRKRPGRTGRESARLPRVTLALTSILLLFPPTVVLAVDAAVNLEDSVQHGQAGPSAFRQSTLRSDLSGSQDFPLAGVFDLRLEGRLLREEFKSRTDTLESDLDRTTSQATASTNYRCPGFRLGVDATQFEQKSSGSGAASPVLSRRQLGSSADLQAWMAHLSLQGLVTDSRQQNPGAADGRLREWVTTFGARSGIPRLGDLAYRFSALVDQNLALHSREEQLTHTITFNGSSRFFHGRGRMNLQTDSNFFTEEQQVVATPAGARIQLPLFGGFTLDDTPLTLDPLEGNPISEPSLHDGNRQTPTTIDIGDAAPAVHQFGGDYRNIEYDFGQAVSISSAILYVDQTLLTSALFQWRAFWSNDPQGRIWTELDPTAFTAVYTEWATGLQGWQFSLSQPQSARFFKVVDVKLGPTVSDLYVTEFEVDTIQPAVSQTEKTSTTSHQLGFTLNYALSSAVHTGYDLSFRRHTDAGQSNALTELANGYSAGWDHGPWSLTSRYEVETLRGSLTQNTAVDAQNVSLRRQTSNASSVDFSWARNWDHSDGIRKLSNSLGLSADWPVAPALQIYQRVSTSWLSDQIYLKKSRAAELLTSAVGSPFQTLTFDLEINDRLVSREAGNGFSRFDEMSLNTGWRPVPLISWQGEIRYQTGPQVDWITQNSVSWELLSRGTLKTTVSASQYRDSLAGQTQEDAGVQLEWAALPTLKFQGSFDSMVITASNQRNAPQNVDLRATWRF